MVKIKEEKEVQGSSGMAGSFRVRTAFIYLALLLAALLCGYSNADKTKQEAYDAGIKYLKRVGDDKACFQ